MHPEPIIRARPAEEDEMPRTATSLIKKATAAGWSATASYAKGWTLETPRTESKVASSVVVRLSLPAAAARAVAVWVDGKFDTAFVWARWSPLEQVGSRAVGGWVESVAKLAATS